MGSGGQTSPESTGPGPVLLANHFIRTHFMDSRWTHHDEMQPTCSSGVFHIIGHAQLSTHYEISYAIHRRVSVSIKSFPEKLTERLRQSIEIPHLKAMNSYRGCGIHTIERNFRTGRRELHLFFHSKSPNLLALRTWSVSSLPRAHMSMASRR